jgi:hypothetical protein
MSVKRYNGMVAESEHGRLVGIEDYDGLQAQLAVVTRDRMQLVSACDSLKAERGLLLAIRGAARGFIDAMAEWEYDEAQGKMIAALDAYDEAMKG